jgi:hypothetical protein
MFGSSVLDVAVGVVFGFLAVSLMTSAIVEAINTMIGCRANSLLSGIQDIMNDPNFSGMAKTLYQHALINPRAPVTSPNSDPKVNKPSYIDKQQFAAALMDITGLSAASATDAAQQPGPAAVAALQTALAQNVAAIANPQIKSMLEGMIQRGQGDIGEVKKDIANWFDSAMDRVGGKFKRWTQLLSFGIALILAVLLNVDTVHLASALWAQPNLVTNLNLESVAPASPTATAAAGGTTQTASPDAQAANQAVAILDANLPVGWASGHFFEVVQNKKTIPIWKSEIFLTACFGWLITAIATLFGAPFWFDILQGAIRLKGSGPSPSEKLSGQAAAH